MKESRVNHPSIVYRNTSCYSFKQIDEWRQAPKGTAFMAFKRGLQTLTEGVDYFYLDAEREQELIQPLRESGQIYRATRHLVLLTDAGCGRLDALDGC
jgi:hypothetical protein